MGAANKCMWKSFGIGVCKTDQICGCPQPCNENGELYFLADPPHMFKNIRNFCVSSQVIVVPNNIVQNLI